MIYFLSENSDYFLSDTCKWFSSFRVPFSKLKISSSIFWYGSVDSHEDLIFTQKPWSIL